jgi:iron complex transport system substrate-binding protein
MIMTLVLFTACSNSSSSETSQSIETTAAGAAETSIQTTTASGQESVAGTTSTEETVLFVDSAGREVEIPKQIDRIAPSGSLAQIVLFSISPDKLVGLSGKWSDNSSDYLDSKYLELPVFGQFYGSEDLNMESLAAADPQVIIDIGEAKDSIVEDMDSIQNQLEIPTIFIEASLETMDECYTTLGNILGMEEAAKILASYCSETYQTTVDTMAEIGDENKKSLIYCVGDTGSNVIAKDSFHAEVLDLLANNVAVVESPSSKGTGNEISMEQIYLWDPDYILFAPNSVYSLVGTDKTWLELEAISSGQYYEVPDGPYNWMGFPPSINRFMGMKWLANLLYPEYFNYDMLTETQNFYKLFYHCDLTDDQYNTLIVHSISK